MSGPKPVRIKRTDEFDDGSGLDVQFTKDVDGDSRPVFFTAAALHAIAEDCAAEYEIEDERGKKQKVLMVDECDLEPDEDDGGEDNGGAGIPVAEPEILEAEIIPENKTPEG